MVSQTLKTFEKLAFKYFSYIDTQGSQFNIYTEMSKDNKESSIELIW